MRCLQPSDVGVRFPGGSFARVVAKILRKNEEDVFGFCRWLLSERTGCGDDEERGKGTEPNEKMSHRDGWLFLLFLSLPGVRSRHGLGLEAGHLGFTQLTAFGPGLGKEE
jgi:hypothetical protein